MTAVYLICNALDMLLTLIGVRMGLTEVNPLMSVFLRVPYVFVLIKLFGGCIVACYLVKAPIFVQKLCAALMVAVCAWNIAILVVF